MVYFPQYFVVVLARRQPCGVLRLVLRKIFSQIFIYFLSEISIIVKIVLDRVIGEALFVKDHLRIGLALFGNTARVGIDGIYDKVNGVAVLRLLFGVYQVCVAHSVAAEHAERCLDRSVNGIGGALVNRRVTSRCFQRRERVLGALLQIDIADQYRHAEYLNVLLLSGEDQRRSVVSTRIGIDNDFSVLAQRGVCLCDSRFLRDGFALFGVRLIAAGTKQSTNGERQ